MPRLLPLVAFLVLPLAACATGPGPEAPPGAVGPEPVGDAPGMPPPVLPSPADDTCGGSGLALLIGQPASALDAMRFAGPVRVIGPDDAVTMDFNPQRLNILTDDQGEITRITCG